MITKLKKIMKECYDMENFNDKLYDTANTRLSDTVRIKGVWAFHAILIGGMMGQW